MEHKIYEYISELFTSHPAHFVRSDSSHYRYFQKSYWRGIVSVKQSLIQISFMQEITEKIRAEAQKLQWENAQAQLFLLHWVDLMECYKEHSQ